MNAMIILIPLPIIKTTRIQFEYDGKLIVNDPMQMDKLNNVWF